LKPELVTGTSVGAVVGAWYCLHGTSVGLASMARDLFAEAQSTLLSIRELLTRAQREELRVRMHPRDVQSHERVLHLQARRVLLSIFATGAAIISAILFIALRNYWLLAGGFAVSFIMFILVFLIPTHLLENPLRHARGIRPDDRFY